MKAISLKQPWASMVANGPKTIETRMWGTAYRGDLLICSTATPKSHGPAGVALAVAELVDVRPMTPKDEEAACCECEEGRQAWVLENIRPVDPFPVRGRQRLFEVEVEELIFLEVPAGEGEQAETEQPEVSPNPDGEDPGNPGAEEAVTSAPTYFLETHAVRLTPTERLKKGEQLSRAMDEVDSVREQLKFAKADAKSKLESLAHRIATLRREINLGEERRLVRCMQRMDLDRHRMDTVRLDTLQVVRSRALRPEELQTDLQLEGNGPGHWDGETVESGEDCDAHVKALLEHEQREADEETFHEGAGQTSLAAGFQEAAP